jgi:hypothetical protein
MGPTVFWHGDHEQAMIICQCQKQVPQEGNNSKNKDAKNGAWGC